MKVLSFKEHKHPLKFAAHLKEHYSELYEQILRVDIEQEKAKEMTTKDYYEALLQIKEGLSNKV